MNRRLTLCVCGWLISLVCGALAQSNSPDALRSAARALTVGEVLGLAERADHGDTESQLLLGLSLQLVAERIGDDEGRAGTFRLAAHWLRRAAEKGSAPAQYFLAETAVKRLGGHDTPNCGEVSESLHKAIGQNYLPAMTALGRLYMEGGCGFKEDYPLGLHWLWKASEAGEPEANYWIGESYEQGRGVKPDEGEATRWFLKGAQMGDPSAQNSAGVNLAEGNGIGKNTDEAVQWFRKSAEQGNSHAACNLALHYIRGEGVTKDSVLALMWAFIADRNVTDGLYCLPEIPSDVLKVTTAQESEATQRANAWLSAHHYPLAPPPRFYSLHLAPPGTPEN